ncbi:MAG: hypothetical protein ACOX5Z_04335 [Desulfobulbus sp.]|jgi:hypothetical protein
MIQRPFRLMPIALFAYALTLLPGPAVQPATAADDEIRAGAVMQVPFNLRSSRIFEPAAIRVGLSCQYVNVEPDTTTTTDHFTSTPPAWEKTTRTKDEGDRVYGVEGNLFLEPFNRLATSVEMLGLYGNNDIQGALGGGYRFGDGFFLDAKAMFPYSEVGIRFLGPLEIYGGLKTLGDFEPADNRTRRVHYRP